MTNWHIETDLIALVLILVVYIGSKASSDMTRKRDVSFLACIIVGLLTTAIDVFSSLIFDYLPVNKGLFYFTQILYHATDNLTIVVWFLYSMCVLFEREKKLLKITTIATISVYAAYVIVIICNIFGDYIFSYSPEEGYARGDAFFLPVAVFAFFALLTCVVAIVFRKRSNDVMIRHTLVFTPLIISIGVTLQLTVPGWLMICPTYAIGLVVTYLTIQRNRNIATISGLSEIAYHDALTGVGNREYALTEITAYLAANPNEDHTLVMIDLDNLKVINDTFGHDADDVVLHELGRLLVEHFEKKDMIARYGGDEFVVFMPHEKDTEAVRNRIKRFLIDITKMPTNGYHGITVSCSIGVSVSDEHSDFETMLRRADMALYSVKHNGKNDVAFYDSAMSEMEFIHSRVDTAATRNVDWFDSYELKQLLGALSVYFPYVISANLTKNIYYAMETSVELTDNLPVYGVYEELIKASLGVFSPSDKDTLLKTFSREKLLADFANCSEGVSSIVQHKSKDGQFRWAQISCLFGRHEENEDVRAYIVVRPYNLEHSAEIERKSLLKVLEIAVENAFEYISLIDLKTGEYNLYGNDGSNSHGVPQRGVYDKIVEDISMRVPKESRNKFTDNASLEHVTKKMNEDSGYHYSYEAFGAKWETRFYYYEDTHHKLLMTVQKL